LRRVSSRHPPLGVLANDALGRETDTLELAAGERIVLYTDGVIEARNPAGAMFGQARLEALLAEADAAFEVVTARLASYRGTADQDDDITLVEISVDRLAAVAPTAGGVEAVRPASHWRAVVELDADALRHTDPLPTCLQTVMALQGIHDHRQQLYVVISELFNNALDHGLLRLDSALKASPEGFGEYYAQRERALAALTTGRIRIEFEHRPQARGGCLRVCVEDSGPGYTPVAAGAPLADNQSGAGRGLALVRTLCREVHVHGRGNRVEVLYDWSV
jgi:anti-sigma regulatory factor (Ser/Thr protein kinase)